MNAASTGVAEVASNVLEARRGVDTTLDGDFLLGRASVSEDESEPGDDDDVLRYGVDRDALMRFRGARVVVDRGRPEEVRARLDVDADAVKEIVGLGFGGAKRG